MSFQNQTECHEDQILLHPGINEIKPPAGMQRACMVIIKKLRASETG